MNQTSSSIEMSFATSYKYTSDVETDLNNYKEEVATNIAMQLVATVPTYNYSAEEIAEDITSINTNDANLLCNLNFDGCTYTSVTDASNNKNKLDKMRARVYNNF